MSLKPNSNLHFAGCSFALCQEFVIFLELEALTTVTMKNYVLWHVKTCNLLP